MAPAQLIHDARVRLLSAWLVAVLTAASAPAQDLSTYYTTQHPQEFTENFTRDLYLKGNQLTAKIRRQYPHRLNLAYGRDEKQRLDLYFPTRRSGKAPILIFIHGGGFLEGDRSHYGFIARPYVAHGIVTAILSYRLTGAGFHYPAQEDDIKMAIRWLHAHAREFGADPDSLFVTGHSAGAVLSAEIGVDLDWLGEAGIDRRILKGIAPVSGPYDLRSVADMANYVPNAELAERASPLLHIRAPVSHAVIAFGTDNEEEDSYSPSAREFADALRAHGVHVEVVVLKGSGHIATAMALGTPDSALSNAVLAMIQGRE